MVNSDDGGERLGSFTTHIQVEVNEDSGDDYLFHDDDYAQSEEDMEIIQDDADFDGNIDILSEEEMANQCGDVSVFHGGEESSMSDDSSNMDSLDESTEEEDGETSMAGKIKKRRLKVPHFKSFNFETDLRNSSLEIGLLFASMGECKEAIREYGIRHGRLIYFEKSDRDRVLVKCKGKAIEGCPFRLYASFDKSGGPAVRIKTLVSKHTCGRSNKQKYCSSSWLAKRFENKFRSCPKMTVSEFQAMVRKKYGLDVSNAQVYKAYRIMRKKIDGTIDDQYALLWDYAHELKRVNPGSTVIIANNLNVGDVPIFKRIYICFGSLKKGFIAGCRTVLGFDGCHLKGIVRGQLLTAVGIDANNGMFPLAYAIVEVECRDSWNWFIELVMSDVDIRANGSGWVITSDRQKGLIQAVEELMPEAEHRFCVRHLHTNFKNHGYTGMELKQRLWSCARASNVPCYNHEMDILKEKSFSAWSWLCLTPAIHWSRSHFGTHSKCDNLLNNLCEAFNRAIVGARDKPILSMLEDIRMYLMLRMSKQRERKWTQVVGPRIFKIIEANREKSSTCIANHAGGKNYQIQHMSGTMFSVDLKRHTCSCRRWDLSGIPCCHAMAAISWEENDALDYVHPVYSRKAYDLTYQHYISPMASQIMWPKQPYNPIKPPMYHKQPGRPPAHKRRREADEVPKNTTKLKRYNIVMHCGICHKEGHNKKTCSQRQHESQP